MTKLVKSYGLDNPLQDVFPKPIISTRAPTSSDKSLPLGQMWINKSAGSAYTLTSVSAGSANWELSTASAGGAPITKYVVDADGTGDYTTIQAAINAANAAGGEATVWVRNGTYTEDLTLYSKINVVGATGFGNLDNCVIVGKHTPPTTGAFIIDGFVLRSATHVFDSAAAGSASIVVTNCIIDITNGYTFNLPNWTGLFEGFDIGSTSTNDGFVNNTGGASVRMVTTLCGQGSANPMIVSGPTDFFEGYPIVPINAQGAAVVNIYGGAWYNTITTSGTASLAIFNSSCETGVNAAISHGSTGTVSLTNTAISSSANPVIAGAGAGALTLASTTFTSGNVLAGTLTLGTADETKMASLKIGSKINVETTGAAATAGTSTLVGGTVTVNTTAVTANSIILLSHQTNAGAPGFVSVTARVVGTSFTITSSSGTDTSTIGWLILN